MLIVTGHSHAELNGRLVDISLLAECFTHFQQFKKVGIWTERDIVTVGTNGHKAHKM